MMELKLRVWGLDAAEFTCCRPARSECGWWFFPISSHALPERLRCWGGRADRRAGGQRQVVGYLEIGWQTGG